MRKLLCFVLGLMSITSDARAQTQPQDLKVLRDIAFQFLQESSKQWGEVIRIELAPTNPQLKLKNCDSPTAFLPAGSKAWGKINVAIRCEGPTNWQIFFPATVSIKASFFITANQLKHGQTLAEDDLIKITGGLDQVPSNAIFSLQEIKGKTVQGNYSSGSILRADMLRAPIAIQQGQAVKLVSSGPGFSVSTDGTALTNANEGQIAKAKTNHGQVLTGIAKLGGIIEIQN